ncbi:nuclear pore complex subunit Nro1-domain-containing protein [Helicostylum pulchrum]|uniref:Uncharacterized protein n=1 Tax=Helicostylum pulchrum TaxID=562976 RepID=A0ABP9XMB3_9FUNG|nr:nuclear pore complex subunit Nro1-domain-containing protein [Helicostylum pulchrum]
MPVEKKRPRGLKGSAMAKANKKTKVQEPSTEMPENAQTVVLDKVVEEGDEVGEAAALYESAIEKLETDPNAALALIRGTIHESDRILRNLEDDATLPALFYYTYGSALYELGRLTDEEEFEPYLDAAEERLNQGLTTEDANDVHNKIQLALAKIWLAKAASAVSEGEDQAVPELSVRALETLDKAMTDAQVLSKTIIELADIVQNHGDLYESIESRDKFRNWAESALNKVLEKEPENASALSGLGLCKLSLANYYLDNLDDDEEDDEEEEEKEALNEKEQQAYQAILDSKKYFEAAKEELVKIDKVSPQVLSDLAETLLNEANLVLKEEDQVEIYKRAVENIKEANALIEEKKLDFILPEALTSFLEEFEA